MAKIVTRECPQCHTVKPYRVDQITCGCPKPLQEKISDTTSKGGRVREINVGATRICNEEQLIAALNIDLTKWYVDAFTVRKWEMGHVQSERSDKTEKSKTKVRTGKAGKTWKTERAVGGGETVEKDWVPGYEQLFAVSCKLKRVVADNDREGYVKDNVKLMRENRRLKFQTESEQRYRTELLKTTSGLDEVLKQLGDIVLRVGEVKLFGPQTVTPVVAQTTFAIKETHNEDAVLLLSDWHCGDVIRPGDTSGFPEFDLPICGNRIGYTIRKAKSVLTMHRAMYPIKKLYVWFGGDMGNGDLHDAPVSNALFIGPQVLFTFQMAKHSIDDLVELTKTNTAGQKVAEEIVLLFTCGNHMREAMAKYMPMKYQAQRTFDWLIYQMLIQWFSQPQYRGVVSIKQAMSPYIFENIRGHRYGFAHGMQVGYRNSPDKQASSMDGFLKLVRALFDSPEWRRKNGLEGASFSKFCIGDIHVPVKFPRLTSNGSMNGQNELGVNWGLEPIPAGQQIFGVTEKHLESWGYFLECSHIQKEGDDWNSYGMAAAEFEREHGRK